MDLKSNFFGKKNIFQEEKTLWERYTLSAKYYAKVQDLKAQANLTQQILFTNLSSTKVDKSKTHKKFGAVFNKQW